MADFTTPTLDQLDGRIPDGIRVRRWFVVFALWLLALGLPTFILLSQLDAPWQDLFLHPGSFDQPEHQVLKLLIFTLAFSAACTFLPLPTGGMVAAMATQQVALTGSLWSTTLLVALCGALGSTMANLNDYHLFTLLLRLQWIARLRTTRTYRILTAWFERSPFLIVMVFNIVPIPLDVVRMLATSHRYSRVPFAAANFLGRFIRYGIFAAGTYAMPQYQVHIVVGMFVLSAALALGRLLAVRREPGG